MTTAVIIDDVTDAREILKSDLQDVAPDIEIIGEADSVVSGTKLLNQHQPDIVFLDIEMPDGDGFDLLDLVKNRSFKTIFTTASDAHALKAFKFSAIDYLLKPIDPKELAKSVQKARGTQDDPQSMKVLHENISRSIGTMERMVLNTQDKLHIVRLTDIVRCESDVNYTHIYLNTGERVLVTKTLKEYDDLLSEHGFIRAHQSHLVNSNYIKEFVKSDGGHLNLTTGGYVPVSTRRKAHVMQALEQLR
ncbi:MAG: response regulator transcription factor [Flavobacteriales bacterium]|nr:response regulator transcription factor [Bacteroidota bacterium]MCB9240592.1 response regulator transcription factor [Flavobacteriales bacterium]